MTVNGFVSLFVSLCGIEVNWRIVQGVTVGIGSSTTLSAGVSGSRRWMDGWNGKTL